MLREYRELTLKGSPGCLKAALVSYLVESGLRVLWIAPRSSSREEALSDLSQFLPDRRVGLLPAPEFKDDISPFEARIFRARALQNWTAAKPFALVAEPASTWLNLLPEPETLDRLRIHLKPGADLGRDRLAERLHQAGYSRADMAENRGEFALRGHILDLFPYTHDTPLRVEFWGERVESLRSFDPITQRTIDYLDGETVFLTDAQDENLAGLISYMNPEDVLLVEEPDGIRLAAEQASAVDTWESFLRQCGVIYCGSPRLDIPRIDFAAIPQEDFGGHIGRLTDSLTLSTRNGTPVFISCDNEGQLERLKELLSDRGLDPLPRFMVAHLSGGFRLPDGAPVLYTDHQIFRRPRRRRTYFRLRNFSPIDRAETLQKGDYVVHEDYGIGCYQGLKTIKVGGHARECLNIQYRDDVTLYVRLELLKKIQKYSGREGFAPPLTRIGRGEWEKIRKRTQKAVKELASDLVKLYALRSAQEGQAFPKDDTFQHEMEASFEYEETPDQLKAIRDVKSDMEESKPMDRLVCGDVGYGKTEVALRAAFKAVLAGKQVGVLVPTTLLAQQHYHNFTKRLSDAAVEIEMLSRFRTAGQQKDILKRLRQGRIDIIIGTHRLLSRDVEFHSLGLLIVDEEHRFGVRHKEKIKALRSQIDVLTLTATPIPRTLHMALIGARDMSLIETAPQDRLPIETEIAPFSRELITEAILREIDRGGQVYFVHNRIQSIAAIAKMLERWLPEVRFVIAHGQMPERQLEKTMSDFLAMKYDCLISTMIIESGLDLPNVNTMIVNRSDRFGLAQLYQLRGRIGRSSRQAYAYLLTPPNLSVSDPARKRLDAIKYCSYLGAGFRLAMHDLEIRGAGEIFGARQSGFIHAVGFDLYQKLLEESIQELKENGNLGAGEQRADAADFEPKIEFPLDAFLPTDYVEKPEQRVDLYRRLSAAQDKRTLDNIVEETVDRYGSPPTQAKYLFSLVEIKISCVAARVPKLELRENYLAAEIAPENGDDWSATIARIVKQLDGEPVEFTGGDPPQIRIKWGPDDSWERKISHTKNLLRRMIWRIPQ